MAYAPHLSGKLPLLLARLLLATPLLATPLAACQDDASCVDFKDCFRDQVCQAGRCVLATQAAPDMPGPSRDASPDASGADLSSSDMATSPLTCLQQPVACREDPQERGSTFAFEIKPSAQQRAVGCQLFSAQEIIALAPTTLQGRLCGQDFAGDWYSIEYARCRDLSYAITLTVTLKTPCAQDDVEVRFDASCGADAQCELERPSASVYRHTLTLGPVSSPSPTLTLPVVIKGKKPNVSLDYTIEASVTAL